MEENERVESVRVWSGNQQLGESMLDPMNRIEKRKVEDRWICLHESEVREKVKNETK